MNLLIIFDNYFNIITNSYKVNFTIDFGFKAVKFFIASIKNLTFIIKVQEISIKVPSFISYPYLFNFIKAKKYLFN
jgi:hypothetical protein